MELFLINTPTGLKPVYPSDYDEKKKLKIGETYRAKIVVPRNYKFHKKFFALLNMALENTDKYDTLDSLLIEVKLKLGHYKLHVTTKGKPQYIPKSISFAKMDQVEFEKFYDRTVDIVLKHFLEGMTPDEVEANIAGFM